MLTAARSAWVDAWEGDLTPSAAAERSATRLAARMRSTRYYAREATARLPESTPESEESPVLPELKVVTRRRSRWGLVLLALAFVGLLLGGTIIVPVLVTTAATGVEAAVGQLEAKQTELAAATAALSARISALSSPDRLAEQAAQLGLGPAQSVQYLETGSEMTASKGETTVAGR
jgi:cell division protein FtsL